jgi:hypothetical protein
MVHYLNAPQHRVIITTGGTSYTFSNEAFPSGSIERNENGIDTAVLEMFDAESRNYPTKVSANSTVQIDFKDSSESTWTTVLAGIIKEAQVQLDGANGSRLILVIDGTGYGLPMSPVAADYGAESIANSSLDTLREIITDASNGIVPAYVNKILGGGASGYSYTADNNTVQDIVGTVNYLSYPYKPADKALKDLCDLIQAIKGANAGPHWIVTTDGKLLCTTVANHSPASISNIWSTYYNGSQANATLTEGIDFISYNLKKLMPEANYILYYCAWLWPGSGDLTENAAIGDWDNSHCTLAYDVGTQNFGTRCLEATVTDAGQPVTVEYKGPGKTEALHLDFSKAGGTTNVPYFGFWVRRTSTFAGTGNLELWLMNEDPPINYFWTYVAFDKLCPNEDEWRYCELPVGPYWKVPELSGVFTGWNQSFAGDWTDINWLRWTWLDGGDVDSIVYLNGVRFKGMVARAAKNSINITNNNLRFKFINDTIGKGDSLYASDDSGTIARMAYAELLRCQTCPLVGTITTQLIKDLLPGQLLHIYARKKADGTYSVNADMRVTKLLHQFTRQNYLSVITVTSDVVNANARGAYTDLDMQLQAVRPSFQDRQASYMKAGTVDITVPILLTDYPS